MPRRSSRNFRIEVPFCPNDRPISSDMRWNCSANDRICVKYCHRAAGPVRCTHYWCSRCAEWEERMYRPNHRMTTPYQKSAGLYIDNHLGSESTSMLDWFLMMLTTFCRRSLNTSSFLSRTGAWLQRARALNSALQRSRALHPRMHRVQVGSRAREHERV